MRRDLLIVLLAVLALAALIILLAAGIAWYRMPRTDAECRQVTDQAWLHCTPIGRRQ